MKNISKPNFMIVGAMKAATTSLYTYLRQHPEIFMSSIKEPKFFNNYKKKTNYIIKGRKNKQIDNFKDYYRLFNTVKNEKAIGEASPTYLYNKNCPKLINKHLPETKIIIVLRQPIERAYSNYLHARKSGREPITNFQDAIKEEKERIRKNWSPLYHYIKQGYYAQQVKRYYDCFQKENIKIILFKDLVQNPALVTKEIFKFLGVKQDYNPNTKKMINKGGVPKGILGFLFMKLKYYALIPNIEFNNYLPEFIINKFMNSVYQKPEKINKKMIKKLTNLYYKEDILQLEKTINVSLKSWLK